MTARADRSPNPAGSRGLWVVLAAVAAVVAVLFVVALLLRGGDDDTATDTATDTDTDIDTAAVSVEGQPLATFAGPSGVADPAGDPAVGMEAPTLQGVGFDGSAVTVGNDGTPRLILFVAHWCPHCQREVPKIQELVDAGRVPDGVEIVAVSTDVRPSEGNYPPSAWLEGEGWSSPVLVDDEQSSAARSFGLNAFPYGVYVDGDGRVVARTAGEIDPAVVEGLLAELAEA